jgi:alcohol dehydrogenase class IV
MFDLRFLCGQTCILLQNSEVVFEVSSLVRIFNLQGKRRYSSLIAIRNLNAALNIPVDLSELGAKEEDVKYFVKWP